jgi:peptidoglycan/LPS O-acetylase OafA/YrhL
MRVPRQGDSAAADDPMRLQASPVDLSDGRPQLESADASPVARTGRIASIDRLRIVAAVGIVWFHTEGAPGGRIGYAGLPIFLLIFFSLVALHGQTDTARRFLSRRWDRLLKPWLFWSLVYGVCRLVNSVRLGEAGYFRGLLSLNVLVTGTNIHLWYLPYSFVLGLVAYAVSSWTLRVKPVVIIMISLGVGALTLVGCAFFMSAYRLVEPIPQWEFGLAALPLGFAIGACMRLPPGPNRTWFLRVICLVVSGICCVLSMAGHAGLAVPYGIALVLVCAAYLWQGNRDIFVTKVAPLTFGIYLIHPLVAYGMKMFVPVDQHHIILIIANVCISGVVTLSLRGTPVRRFL